MHPPPAAGSSAPNAAEQAGDRLALLRLLALAADEAPTMEEALRRTLALLCAHAGFLAGRLQFAQGAALSGRVFWHLMQSERLAALRALAQERRGALVTQGPGALDTAWTPLEPQLVDRTGVHAIFAAPVALGGRLLARLELFSPSLARPADALLEVIAFACAELGRVLQRKPQSEAHGRTEREYRSLFENAHDGMVVLDPAAQLVLDANGRACALYGCSRAELVGLPLQSLWTEPAEERRRLEAVLSGSTVRFETRHLRKDGVPLVVEVSAGPVEFRSQRAIWMSVRDATEKHRMVEQLRASEERYRRLFEASPQPMWVANNEGGRFLAVNEAAVRRYGFSREQFAAMTDADLSVGQQRPPPLPGASAMSRLARHRNAGGAVMDVEVTEHGVDFEGEAARLTVASDVTERVRAEERLWRAAFYDALTGLPNRALFMERLGQAQARARGRGGHGFAVFFLDLDRFKYVNDSLGHSAGDGLLQQIGQRLERARRAGDTVARLGGDEFAILVEGVHDAHEAVLVADRIQRALAAPFTLVLGEHGGQGQEVYSSASIGIAMGGREQKPEDLLRDADTAMYRAKGKGLGASKHVVFDIGMHDQAVQTLRMESDLRRALERRELFVVYQPVVRLSDGAVVGFEALSRWQHPQRGPVPPAEFVPLAEETGLVSLLDRWVLEEACRTMVSLQQRHPRPEPLSISVNLSGRELLQPELAEQVEQILARTGLAPRSLKLEITETVLVENEAPALRCLTSLKALGVRLCLDDFGTGYSSLSYLHRMPIDVLKVDASFVRQVGEEKNRRIVETLVLLGQNLGLDVVAEGVETLAQAAELLGLGCELAQGFLYAEPLPAAQAEQMLGREEAEAEERLAVETYRTQPPPVK
jgi:diguanylate cyclase (GGDEF)-like protein/PAS domain S-box-containing protein